MRKGLQRRLTEEYRYAVSRMQQEGQAVRKLYYFSVFYSEAQRVLNSEWNRDLALIYGVTFHTYTQVNAAMQSPALMQLPMDWAAVYDKLTVAASDLTSYLERSDNDGSEELREILGRLAEIAYVVSGNGIYLHGRGSIKL